MKAPILVLSRMLSSQDDSDCYPIDKVRNDLYHRAVKMWNKRKPFRILVIAVDEAVLKLESEVLLNCERCFALSNISRGLVSAFDMFAAGGGDLCKIDTDIAQDTGLIPVLARICLIFLRTDYKARQCFPVCWISMSW